MLKEIAFVEINNLPFECGYHGVFRAVAPWAPQPVNRYNTSYDIEIPLQFDSTRHDQSWEVMRNSLSEEMENICSLFQNDPVNVASMTQRYKWHVMDPITNTWVETQSALKTDISHSECSSNLMSQIDEFVSAVCAQYDNDPCLNPTSFADLTKLTGTDKSNYFHNFAAFYDMELNSAIATTSSFQKKSILKQPRSILEVGVLHGFSLSAWSAKYPCAEIFGWDNNVQKNSTPYLLNSRFHISYADQLSKQSMYDGLNEIYEKHNIGFYDFIIDDGGHSMIMQQNTLDVLWNKVSPCGIYILEDLQTSFEDITSDFIDSLPTSYDIITGNMTYGKSKHVNIDKIMKEIESIKIYRPNNDHVTAVIHKKCKLP